MIRSMTGYGKAEAVIGTKKVTVEVRSLNSKFLDCNLRMPGIYREKEMEIRSMLASRTSRGKIDLTISYDILEGEQNFTLNTALVKNYYGQVSGLLEELDLPNKDRIDFLANLMRMPDVMKQDKQSLSKEEWSALSELISNAIDQFNAFRETEGESLANDLKGRISSIENLLAEVPKYEEERIETVKTRIKKNLSDILEDEKIDNNRFEQELIYYLEKYDVSEEKVRLQSHCEHFTKTMAEKESQGKKLGFIGQEIGREINTLGSKANHSEMQKIVVQMKDELEKIKEQVLNAL